MVKKSNPTDAGKIIAIETTNVTVNKIKLQESEYSVY